MSEQPAFCELRERHRDGRLSPQDAERFAAHLQGCADCLRWARQLDQIAAVVKTRGEAILWPRERKRSWSSLRDRQRRRRRLEIGGLAVLAAACAVAIFIRAPCRPPAGASIAVAPSPAPIERRTATNARGSLPGLAGRVMAAGAYATLALSPDASLESTSEDAVTLGTGGILASVRPLPPGGHFSVSAGAITVVVHGTRFAVLRDGSSVTVMVEEGLVEVDADGAPAVFLRRGTVGSFAEGSAPSVRELADADAGRIAPLDDLLAELSPGATAPPAPIASILASIPQAPARTHAPARPVRRGSDVVPCRQLLERHDARGAAACCEHLLESPPGGVSVVELRMLLGDARRISGDLAGAADAYRDVADAAPGSADAENALFEIGRMYTDAPGENDEAVQAWDRYLREFPHAALRDEAERALADLERRSAGR